MEKTRGSQLHHHLSQVKSGSRCFENAFQGVARMILESDIQKVTVNGKTTYDFSIFRTGKKHVIGLYDEINSFVSYVKDAAEGGSSNEMAYVLVGEPGNGKTFFVEFLCSKYRNFLAKESNRKYTFKFINMDSLGNYGRIKTIESQTYEDPMILAMNLFDDSDENKQYLAKQIGFSDKDIEKLYDISSLEYLDQFELPKGIRTYLLAAYNPDRDVFETVTKVGTGFTDADLEKLPQLLNQHKINHKHPRVDSTLDVDVWFEPAVVIDIRGAELTLSPVHTCAKDVIREGSGVAIRFPRFTGKYRIDKSAEDATTTEEVVEMYRGQLKKIDG